MLRLRFAFHQSGLFCSEEANVQAISSEEQEQLQDSEGEDGESSEIEGDGLAPVQLDQRYYKLTEEVSKADRGHITYTCDPTMTNIENLTSKSYVYEVPPYQRSFEWTADRVNQFMGDIYKGFLAEEIEVSFGVISLFKDDRDSVMGSDRQGIRLIVDGLQRLTVVMVLASFLRHKVCQELPSERENIKDLTEVLGAFRSNKCTPWTP